MILCPKARVGFIHNHKAGGMSIGQWLSERCPEFRRDGHEHQTAQDALTTIGEDAWRYLYTFGFVRNPWERMVSWWFMFHENPGEQLDNPFWKYVRANATNFEEFLDNCTDPIEEWGGTIKSILRPQLHYFTDSTGEVRVNFIGRFENLQRDLDTIAKNANISPGLIGRHNYTKTPKDYRDHYNARTRRLVETRFAVDIDTFKYTFKENRPLSWM